MIARLAFLKLLGATTVATGGLDVWSGGALQIRVLVSGDSRGETPAVAYDGTFAFGGKRWRGAPSKVRTAGGTMALVTTIDVDQYLQGVLPLEIPALWPTATLEAFAIAARSFALARRSLSRDWDVSATEADQRWGGVEAELPATTQAIAATRGRTVTYAGSPASVFYSSCCGGHTADIASAWGAQPLAYLRGVVDPYCVQAPDFRWSRDVPLERVNAAFAARAGGTIGAAALDAPDISGRPRDVLLTGTSVAAVPIADFRRALGGDAVRSTWLRALSLTKEAAPRLLIEGSGRGHGVGICQWGARALAVAGASAEQILAFYLPGTAVTGG